MKIEELKIKAASLPLEPGVYLMKDSSGQVIYVGKAKKLRNRVSQYFVDTVSHSPKTRMMVSKIDDFQVILATSEFEALVLECAQIKRYMPKYNILLKDDKGYPYIQLSSKETYPRLCLASRPDDDGEYFGPYGSRGITQNLIDTITQTLMLPSCNKKFPRDFGKGRPCLHYHMNHCAGWCMGELSAQEYQESIRQAKHILNGNYKQVLDELRKQMLQASEMLNFELAAAYRDKLQAIELLSRRQSVTAGNCADIDAIGFGQTQSKACFAVLHFVGGELVDKDYEIIPTDNREDVVSSLLKQYYLSRGIAPKMILLPFPIEDGALFEQMLTNQFGRRTYLKTPMRGENLRLIELANKNALEEAQRITAKEDRTRGTVSLLGKMLSIETPNHIESFDISNISGTDNVASMVVFVGGKPCKSKYKKFKVERYDNADDYDSMRQVLMRRFQDFLAEKSGFADKPDLLLIDGGITHANVALQVLKLLSLDIPVFGMVKDNRHRTRALVTPQGEEIRIDSQPSVFSFIGTIQEETHRFAISYHRNLRSKRLRQSELDRIVGIGPKRKQMLLKKFSSISAIKDATIAELEHILPADAAMSVYTYYHPNQKEEI